MNPTKVDLGQERARVGTSEQRAKLLAMAVMATMRPVRAAGRHVKRRGGSGERALPGAAL